jgi:hypothetical protein
MREDTIDILANILLASILSSVDTFVTRAYLALEVPNERALKEVQISVAVDGE